MVSGAPPKGAALRRSESCGPPTWRRSIGVQHDIPGSPLLPILRNLPNSNKAESRTRRPRPTISGLTIVVRSSGLTSPEVVLAWVDSAALRSGGAVGPGYELDHSTCQMAACLRHHPPTNRREPSDLLLDSNDPSPKTEAIRTTSCQAGLGGWPSSHYWSNMIARPNPGSTYSILPSGRPRIRSMAMPCRRSRSSS